VQSSHRRLPGSIVDGHYVKPARTVADVPFREESLSRSNY
jgi:hypothetical protein